MGDCGISVPRMDMSGILDDGCCFEIAKLDKKNHKAGKIHFYLYFARLIFNFQSAQPKSIFNLFHFPFIDAGGVVVGQGDFEPNGFCFHRVEVYRTWFALNGWILVDTCNRRPVVQ